MPWVSYRPISGFLGVAPSPTGSAWNERSYAVSPIDTVNFGISEEPDY